MKVSILTPDSKQPNLAAMKISAWHKAQGDSIELNMPLLPADFTYASILFQWTQDPISDLIGGPKYPHIKLDPEIEAMKPDYSLYPEIDYSLGYTYRACPRTCDNCIVPLQNNSEDHHSIFSFHDKRFKKICLLNNNTLADHYCRETFKEIIENDLILKDTSGFDVRLMTDEYAHYLSQIRFDNYFHIAWDFPEHKKEILKGIRYLLRHKIKKIICYVMIGHTTHKENMYRVMRLRLLGIDPFVMPLNKDDRYQKSFARWVNFKPTFKTVKWADYKF